MRTSPPVKGSVSVPPFSRTRLLALGAAVVASAVLLVAPGAEAAPTASTTAEAAPTASTSAPGTARYAVNRPLCAPPARADQFRCFAVASEPASADTPGAYRVAAIGHGRRGHYSPDDLAKAYSYNPNVAVNQTVAVVDWYDDPYALADLNAFDRAYHLPAETSRSFRKVNQDGRRSPLPQRSWDTATEIALDVQAVRGVCHKCRILLVEANAPTSADLARAENTAVRLGANEISNSFGGPEGGVSAAMTRAFNHPGVVITASTGDDGWFGWDYANSGYQTDRESGFPASSPAVVAVGGTTLRITPNGTRKSETVWNNNGPNDSAGGPGAESMGATGGGCSRRFTAGTWQWHTAGYGASRGGRPARNRLAADIAAV